MFHEDRGVADEKGSSSPVKGCVPYTQRHGIHYSVPIIIRKEEAIRRWYAHRSVCDELPGLLRIGAVEVVYQRQAEQEQVNQYDQVAVCLGLDVAPASARAECRRDRGLPFNQHFLGGRQVLSALFRGEITHARAPEEVVHGALDAGEAQPGAEEVEPRLAA